VRPFGHVYPKQQKELGQDGPGASTDNSQAWVVQSKPNHGQHWPSLVTSFKTAAFTAVASTLSLTEPYAHGLIKAIESILMTHYIIIGPTGQPSEDGGTGRYQSDTDRTRSASPMSIPTGIRINNLLNDDDSPTIATTRSRGASGRSTRNRAEMAGNFQRIILKTRVDQVPDLSSPVPPGIGHPVLHPNNPDGVNQKRPRPQTAHQQAVNENRKARVEHILHNKLKEEHAHHRNRRKHREGFLVKAARRISELPDLYDSEDENSWGPGGLVPNPGEEEDYGEEAMYKQKILNRALRRVSRWEDGIAEPRTFVKGRGYKGAGLDPKSQRLPRRKRSGTPVVDDDVADIEELDDLELELLGESRRRGGGGVARKSSRREARSSRLEAQEEDLESLGEDSGSDEHESDDDEDSDEGMEEMNAPGSGNGLLGE